MIEIRNRVLSGYTFIDLFAGLGGFRLALESLGARCVYSSEWDRHASAVYADNFNDMPDGDITQVDEHSIPDHDILCAGFPCQPFSISGNQNGFLDARGTLFFDVARIISARHPKVILMENVRNFASHDGGRTLAVVKKTMEDAGYAFYYQVLDAADYGIPQSRKRIYMVCIRKDLGINSFHFPQPFVLDKHVEDILLDDEELVRHLYVSRPDIHLCGLPDDHYDSKPIRLGTVNKGGQGERIYSIKGTAITLSAYGGGAFARTGGYLIDGRPRRLHPRECARLMGFPDDYRLCDNVNQAYRQLGNSVVVDVLQYIAEDIGIALNAAQEA